jgi:hypothetical protein
MGIFFGSALWKFLGDELSLQKFSMARIAHNNDQIPLRELITLSGQTPMLFSVLKRWGGSSFHQWMDGLTPLRSPDTTTTYWWQHEDQGKQLIS